MGLGSSAVVAWMTLTTRPLQHTATPYRVWLFRLKVPVLVEPPLKLRDCQLPEPTW